MINEENKEEIIEQYLEGALTGEDLQEFEEKMAADAAFRREVALQKKIVHNVQTVGREQLRAQLKGIHKLMLEKPQDEGEIQEEAETEVKVVPLSPNKSITYAIAAAIVLLIVAGIFVVLNQDQNTFGDPLVASLPVEVIGADNTTRGDEMMDVAIYSPNDTLTQHYQFTDTLKLYGPFKPLDVHIIYNEGTGQYKLRIHEKTYGLKKTEEIMPLEEE